VTTTQAGSAVTSTVLLSVASSTSTTTGTGPFVSISTQETPVTVTNTRVLVPSNVASSDASPLGCLIPILVSSFCAGGVSLILSYVM
jgi:hypothetical protein